MSTRAVDIYTALMARAGLMATTGPTLPVSLPEPETTFEAPNEGGYIQVADFTNSPFWEGITSGRIDQGILLVTVVWEKNRGLTLPKEAAGLVEAHFTKHTVMTSGAYSVRVSREPYQASPIIEETEVRIPVTVAWTARPA